MNNNDRNNKEGIVGIRIIEGYTNYIIYSNGTIRNCKKDTLLNAKTYKTTKAGYRTVSLRNDNGIRKTFLVHRLIYETFIGVVPQGMQINHIDEDKTNNLILFNKEGKVCYSNLEVVTPKENCNHGSRNIRISMSCTGKEKITNKFKVMVTNFKTGETDQEEYNSMTELCKAHPTQNRLTWYYRLYKTTRPKPLYTTIEGDTLLQIFPTNEEYKTRLQEGEQH